MSLAECHIWLIYWCSLVLTGVRQIQVGSAGWQHSGVDARNNTGLIHDELHNVVICSQLTLQTTSQHQSLWADEMGVKDDAGGDSL